MPFASGYMGVVFQLFTEDDMISRFQAAKVDYIVLASRWTPEQGTRAFGVDYARRFHEWMRRDYDVVKQFGPYPYTSDEFGIAILKKKQADSAVSPTELDADRDPRPRRSEGGPGI